MDRIIIVRKIVGLIAKAKNIIRSVFLGGL
jgi:hypothetical protein